MDGVSGWNPVISADGRHIVFAGDGDAQLYVHDRDTDGDGVFDEPGGVATVLVSAAADGTPGDGWDSDLRPTLSRDGRFVAFQNDSSNLVPDDTNGYRDITRRDDHTTGRSHDGTITRRDDHTTGRSQRPLTDTRS